MKQKLLRLAKKLNKFTIDDLVTMLEEDFAVIEKELEPFLASGKIRKQKKEGSYIYFEDQQKFQSTNKKLLPKVDALRVVFSQEEVQKFFDDRKTSKAYKNAPKFIQKKVDKYVFLLREVNGLTGVWLDEYIKNKWNKEHPDMKTSKTCFVRARKELKRFGIEGLIPVARIFTTQKSNLSEKLYSDFKEYLFQNTGKTLKDNYNKYKEKFLNENPDMESWEFPTYCSVTTRIQKDVLKFNDEKLSKFYRPGKRVKIDEPKKYGFNDFKSAAIDYLRYLTEERKLKNFAIKNYTTYINYHLIPFFEKYRLDEINEKIIKKYKLKMQQHHLRPTTIKKQIATLEKILRIYSPDKYSHPVKNFNKTDDDIKILTNKEIKTILQAAKESQTYKNDDLYLIILTALMTGMTPGEIFALQWEKIDRQKNKIFVNTSIYRGEVTTHKIHTARRKIDVPESLLIALNEWQNNCPDTEFVFPDPKGKPQEPDDVVKNKFNPLIEMAGVGEIGFMNLRDTYAAILIEKNLPLTYIQKQLGHSSANVTADRYRNFIDKNNPESLNSIFIDFKTH